jgi:NAD(P)-dependent dehydrogenase (short-subunit alcohol dehydrogenase family)
MVVDVTDQRQMDELAEFAIATYGGFDAWINNAGISIYGLMENVPVADARRLFDVNYSGVVHGSLAALRHWRQRAAEHGAALINIGSVLSDRAIPLQGHYSASKHAVKGFTDALRVELRKTRAPISVSLVKPSAVDTPYIEHARNHLEVEPLNPPPVYHPRLVARAILACAVRPRRTVVVGGAGRLLTTLALLPHLADFYTERVMYGQQRTDIPAAQRPDSLERPAGTDGRERGMYPGRVLKRSVYTALALRPRWAAAAAVVGLGWALVRRRRNA